MSINPLHREEGLVARDYFFKLLLYALKRKCSLKKCLKTQNVTSVELKCCGWVFMLNKEQLGIVATELHSGVY